MNPVTQHPRDIEFLTTSQYEDLVVSDRRRHGRLDVASYVKTEKPSFLNSVILYYGRDMADISDTVDQVTDQVQDFMHLDLICKLAEDPRFNGSAVSCGSTSEGVKVRIPNEFDFIFEVFPESLNSDHLVLEPVMPETFRPRKANSDVYERSFFRISFHDHAAELRHWDSLMRCKECLNVETCNSTHQARYLCPRAVQNALANSVERSVSTVAAVRRTMSQVDTDSDSFGRNFVTEHSPLLLSGSHSEISLNCDPPQPSMVKRNGPAVSCYTRSDTLPHPGVVKIDITFAIPFRKHTGQQWPLDHFKHMTLCDHVTAQGQAIEKCYLVPAGDYWRVTFVTHEQQHMRELLLEDNKKYCFQAVKCLRDELSLTDDYESALLSSYPLKVSFMKENLENPQSWPNDSLADRAISILGRVDTQGANKTLTSFYIQNDPLFPGDSDQSHVETRRMLYYLNEQTKVYLTTGPCMPCYGLSSRCAM